jgi:hypothetical protein
MKQLNSDGKGAVGTPTVIRPQWGDADGEAVVGTPTVMQLWGEAVRSLVEAGGYN